MKSLVSRCFRSLPLTLLLAAPSLAQDEAMEMAMPTPADELRAFAPMIGSWEGSGTFENGEAQPGKWTAVSEAKWILGEFAVQEDMRVDVEGMGAMLMRNVYGFDTYTGQYVVHSFSNMGGGASKTLTWLDDKTMYMSQLGHDMLGQPKVERFTYTFGKDGYEFWMEEATANQPAAEVRGTFRRTAKPAVGIIDAAASRDSLSPEHKRLDKLVGRYDITGTVHMPGMRGMEITAVDHVSWILGGAVQYVETEASGGYSAISFTYWDAAKNCYTGVQASNMGEIGTQEMRITSDGSLAYTGATWWMGSHGLSRATATLDEGGHLQQMTAIFLPDSGEAYTSFEATYVHSAAGETAAETTLRFKDGSCCARAQTAGNTCAHPCCVTAAAKGEVCKACNS